MENPGEYLKREREQRDIPLSKIAESTRVPIKCLEALEADDFDSLPHPTFVKGYIKSYCKILGLDETDAVLRYELYLKEKNGSAEEENVAEEARKKQFSLSPPGAGERAAPSGPFSAGYVITMAVIIVAVAVIYYYTSSSRKTALAPVEPMAPAAENTASVEKPAVESASPQAAAANGQAPAAAAGDAKHASESAAPLAAAPGDRHSLTVSAAELTWVKVAIDDDEPFDVVLRPGEKVSWKAAKAFHIVVGNAGGVSVNFDGEEFNGLGASGEVVKLAFPKAAPAQKPKKPAVPKTSGASIVPAAGVTGSAAPARAPKAVKKPVPGATQDLGAGINGSAAGITPSAAPARVPKPAVKKPAAQAPGTSGPSEAAQPETDEGAGGASQPRWDSNPQNKFEVRPAEDTAE